MSAKTGLTLATLALAVAVAGLLALTRTGPPPGADASPRTEPASSRVEPARSRRDEVVDLSPRGAPPGPAVQALAPPPRDAPGPDPGVDPGEPPPDAVGAAAVMLDRFVASEARDPQWGPATERAARDAFAGPGFPGVRLVNVDCRRTVCRAVVEADHDEGLDGVHQALARTPPFNTQGFIQHLDDEFAPRLVVIFAREGRGLREAIQP
jgi:hypothetical protein